MARGSQSLAALKAVGAWLDERRQTILSVIDAGLVAFALLAVAALVARVGFYLDDALLRRTQAIETAMLYFFALQAFVKSLLAKNKRQHVRERWLELVIFAVILVHLVFPRLAERALSSLNPRLTPETLTSLYLILTQFFVVVALVPSALRYSKRVMAASVQPSSILLASFVALSLVGCCLLLLPKASNEKIAFIDALFIATSAACVTGLATLDVATTFTHVGHWILLSLIQIGGLGIMTLTTFFATLAGGSSQLKEYAALRELLGEESLGKARTILYQVGFYTCLAEAIGALCIYRLIDAERLPEGVSPFFFSVFHSVSAFCNAGFSLLSENLADARFRGDLPFLHVIVALVVIGGLGFPALSSLSSWAMAKARREPNARLTVHARIVFIASGALLALGTLGVWALEGGRSFASLSPLEQVAQALFHSAMSRTAGFNAMDVAAFSTATLFLTIVLMWIGASPSSTGGGIKTTTATLAILNIYAIASGRNKIELFRRRIPDLAITRAFSAALLSLLYIALALFALLLTEQDKGFAFEALLFEVVSAVSTVGLSVGVTPHLSDAGKIVIILSMLVGRVGFLTVVIALARRRAEANYDYAEETVLVS
ncbi:MAG: ATPase [Chloroherpetonaceae bacterium]|nr:ATPase [Chloroherpetonaceae bacterium]MDW8437509.1 potassium transporter TrkG [Chloroherpetonaceae bacterium]